MTTSFNYAFSGTETNRLRGIGGVPSYGGGQYASQLPNTVVFAAQFNSSQNVSSYAQEEWSVATVGAYTDVLPGQRFLASATSSMAAAYFDGRARKAFGPTTAYFNETGIPQSGGDKFWIVDDYPILDKLIRFDLNTNTYLVDYDVAYRALRPVIGSANDNIGLKGCYAGFISPSSSKFRISISALFYPCESASTITSWSLNYKDGTVVSGSASGSGTTTGTITIDFPTGFRHIIFTATNSAGTSSTTAIKVWAETRTGSATLITGFGGSTISLDASTPGAISSCNIDVFTNELQNTLNNTPICIWDEEVVDGTLGSVGGNVRFIGRLRKEQNVAKSDPNYSRTLITKWTLEGADTQLQRVDGVKFTMQDNISPANWGDIKSMSLPKIASLLLTEFTTFCNGNVVNFDTYDDTFPYPVFNTSGTTMLDILNDVYLSITGQMQFSPDGRASLVRNAMYLSGSARNALTTIANWQTNDVTDTNLQFDDIRNVALVDAWGGEDTGAQQVTPLHSMAPGIVRDIGERNERLLKQILSNVGVSAANDELSDRAGNHWQKLAQQRRLTVTHPDAYGSLMPDVAAWYTWTITAADSNLRNIAYTSSTRWVLERINQTHDNAKGKKDIEATYLLETTGAGYGHAIAIPTTNTIPTEQLNLALTTTPLIAPLVPPIEMSGPDAARLKQGIQKLALILSDGTRTTTTNFGSTPPTWTTPVSLGVSGTVLQWVPDFHSGYLAGGGAGSKTYGWIITATGVYYGEINTPSFTLGHSFRLTSSLRSASASLVQAGHIVIVTDYGDGTYVTYATTGANWTGETSIGTGGGTFPPGCWYSQHTALVVYTSVVGTGKKSNDGGATWSSYAAIDPGTDCAVDIGIPYPGNPTDAVPYYATDSAPGTTTDYDFTTGLHGWVAGPDCGGTQINGTGLQTTVCDRGSGNGSYMSFLINFFGGPVSIIAVEFKGSITGSLGASQVIQLEQASGLGFTGSLLRNTSANPAGPTFDITDSGFLTTGVQSLLIDCEFGTSRVCTVTDIIITLAAPTGEYLAKYTTSLVPISPQNGYAPWKSLPQISLDFANGNIIGVGAGDSTQTNAGLWVSANGGTTWTTLVAPTTDGSSGRYDWLPMSGQNPPVLYPAGSKGRIGYSAGLSGPVVDKRGNLSTSASVVGLAGFRS